MPMLFVVLMYGQLHDKLQTSSNLSTTNISCTTYLLQLESKTTKSQLIVITISFIPCIPSLHHLHDLSSLPDPTRQTPPTSAPTFQPYQRCLTSVSSASSSPPNAQVPNSANPRTVGSHDVTTPERHRQLRLLLLLPHRSFVRRCPICIVLVSRTCMMSCTCGLLACLLACIHVALYHYSRYCIVN